MCTTLAPLTLTLTLLLATLSPATAQAEPPLGVQYKVCDLYFTHLARWYGDQGQFDAGEAALDLAHTAADKGRHPNIQREIREIDLASERFFLYHPIEENLPALGRRYHTACVTLLQAPAPPAQEKTPQDAPPIDWRKRLFPTPEEQAAAARTREGRGPRLPR